MDQRNITYKSYNLSAGHTSSTHKQKKLLNSDDDSSSGCLCFGTGDEEEENMNETRIIEKNKKRKVVKGCISSFTVCLGLISYTFLGAILFVIIEGDGLLSRKNNNNNELLTTNFGNEPRERAVENIWEITVNLNILYRENWTKLASQEISRFQEKLIEHLSKELNNNKDVTTSETNWDLARSLLYSITILTTTGEFTKLFQVLFFFNIVCKCLNIVW